MSNMVSLGDAGEFGAIGMLKEILAERGAAASLEVNLGDDAAGWRPTPGRLALETTDLLIQDVHFTLDLFSWYDVGWKSLAVNISDIAAMGGIPSLAFVSLGLQPAMAVDDARELFRGLADCAAAYGVSISGGDTVTSPMGAVLNVALYGESADESGRVLLRDAACPGDAIAVSGPLGGAAAALALWQRGRRPDDAVLLRQTHPLPKVALGQQLLAAGVRCAMDVSDGLLGDVGKMCQASGVGAEIRLAPDAAWLDPAVRQLLPERAIELALAGGEDYELLACGDEATLARLGLLPAGRIVAGNGVHVINESGDEYPIEHRGYDAFLHKQLT